LPSSEEERLEVDLFYSRMQQVKILAGTDEWVWVGAAASNFSFGAVRWALRNNGEVGNYFVMKRCHWVLVKCNVLA